MIPRYDSPLMPATQTFSVECDAALEDLKFPAFQMTDLRKRIIWLGLYSTFLLLAAQIQRHLNTISERVEPSPGLYLDVHGIIGEQTFFYREWWHG